MRTGNVKKQKRKQSWEQGRVFFFFTHDDETMDNTRRIVLLGKTGTGKSSVGNTIFGDNSVFPVSHSPNSETRVCQSVTKMVHGRRLTVIDTPGFFDTNPNSTGFSSEILRCVDANPHAFLLVLKVERYTAQENNIVQLILAYFSEEALQYTTLVFTHGENLPTGMRIQDWARQSDALTELLERCGNRCHVFDNTHWNNQRERNYRNNHNQVQDLLLTIDQTVAANGGRYFTSSLMQNKSLWARFRDAPAGVQLAAFLGVVAVGCLLYHTVPWAQVSYWVIMTAREGAAWAWNNLPSEEALRKAIVYLATLHKLFEQIAKTKETVKQFCTIL